MKSIYNLPSIKVYQCSNHLDFLRSLAALEVFLGHCRNLFFVDYEDINRPNIFLKLFYFSTGFGHQAVIIFFILSGFLISSSVLRARQNNRWSWNWYLTNRLTRLEVVLIPALLLCYFWDSLGINIFGNDSIYAGKTLGSNVLAYNVSEKLNLLTFFGNLFFLQNILVPTLGSNNPLWSLSNEFWYYILFPLCLLIFFSKISLKTKLFYSIVTLFIAFLIGHSILLYFLIWLMGALISSATTSKIINSKKTFKLFCCLSILILASCLTIVRINIIKSEILSDFLVGIAASILVYVLLHDRTQAQKGIYGAFSHTIAGFSYTLYVVHLPLLVFIRAYLVHSSRWQPTIFNLGLGLFICAIVFVYAFTISCFTEAKTDKIRHTIELWIHKRLSTEKSS